MAEKMPDEIMAEYLLKGAKMLSRSCATCGSPLFEVKGETRCVVCAEGSHEEENSAVSALAMKVPTPGPEETAILRAELTRTLIGLCKKVREEPNPERCLVLMEAISKGVDALRTLTQ